MSDLDAYRSLFVAESRENHEGIVSNLLTLEQGTDSHAIDEIFRSAHSLKGMSASMGFMHMEEICHALEDVFSQIRNGTLDVSQSLMDDLLAGADDIELMIDDVEAGGDGLLEHRDERVTALKAWISPGGSGRPALIDGSGTAPVSAKKSEEESTGDMYENPAYESYDSARSSTYHIHIELSHAVDNRNLRSMLILQNLDSIGHILAITPQRNTIEDDRAFDGSIDLTLITNAGHEAVETILAISDIASSSITEMTDREYPSDQSPQSSPQVVSSLADEDAQGNKRFSVHVELSSSVDSKNLRAMLILQNLENIGHISAITPQRSTVEDDPSFVGSIDLTLITNAGHEAVETILAISDIAFSSITEMSDHEYPSDQSPQSSPQVISSLADEVLQGNKRYSVHVELSSSVDSKNLRAMLLLQNIESLGKIVNISPKREMIEDSVSFNGSFDLDLLSASTSENQIKGLLKSSDIKMMTVTTLGDLASVHVSESREVLKGEQGTHFRGQAGADKVEKKREVKNIRVDIDRLDHMMNLVEDLVINRGRLEQIAQEYKIKELDETLSMVGRSVADLQVMMMDIRMIPLNQIFNRFPRTVRDYAAKEGKEIEFIVEGGDTELDRSVLDGLNDPLLHLIRNGLDHGIEMPDVRVKNGKNPKGTLKLAASRDKDNVIIVIEDDGAGIDQEKVKKKALERGLLTEDILATMSESEINDLLFLPGFSTADKISDISGRGVGLDVVKTTIASLQGTIKLESVYGKGSRFELVLPPTMAIVMVMMIRINNRRCAIPIANIAEVASLAAFPIQNIGHGEGLLMRDEIIILCRLDDMFGRSKKEEVIVVLQNQNKKGVIVADLIEGQQEVVIKPLSKFVGTCEGISGVTIPGDGEVVPVLDVKAILKEGAGQKTVRKSSVGKRVKMVMKNKVIVDSEEMITDLHADYLRELGNIGASHAATTLSTILSTMISIKVPDIIIVQLQNLGSYIDDTITAIITFQIQGQVAGSGYIVLLIPKDSIIHLTNIMLGQSTADREIDDMDKSALNEVGNIMTSSFLDACATLLSVIMLPSPPSMVIDMPLAALETLIATQEIDDHLDQVVLFKTELQSAAHQIVADIMLLPSKKLLAELFSRMDNLMASSG